MNAWLSRARDALANEAGIDPSELDLDGESSAMLLDLARLAAHEGGARTNAPLLCYLLGLARKDGAALDALADAVRRSSS